MATGHVGDTGRGQTTPPVIGAVACAIWFEYAKWICARCQMRGERSVVSQPCIRAAVQVMGQKMFDSPILLWSSQFCARVWNVSSSSAQPRKGIETPNWYSSSRSPFRGAKVSVWLVAKSSNGPVAVNNGGG